MSTTLPPLRNSGVNASQNRSRHKLRYPTLPRSTRNGTNHGIALQVSAGRAALVLGIDRPRHIFCWNICVIQQRRYIVRPDLQWWRRGMLCCLTSSNTGQRQCPRRVSFHDGNLASDIRMVAQISGYSPRHCELCDKEGRPGEDRHTLIFLCGGKAGRPSRPCHRTQPPVQCPKTRDLDLTPSLQPLALPSLLKHGLLAQYPEGRTYLSGAVCRHIRACLTQGSKCAELSGHAAVANQSLHHHSSQGHRGYSERGTWHRAADGSRVQLK